MDKIDRTPEHLRCPVGECPSVHEREDGKLVIVGEAVAGIRVGIGECAIVVDPKLLSDIKHLIP